MKYLPVQPALILSEAPVTVQRTPLWLKLKSDWSVLAWRDQAGAHEHYINPNTPGETQSNA